MTVGRPPELASAFQPRTGLREQILTAHRHGDDVVLAQSETTRSNATTGTQVLAGGGGGGKSQLAAWFARHAADQSTDLIVWTDASSTDQIITTYATTAVRVGAPGAAGTDLAADAGAFLDWLHRTDRSWLVVLDDVTDPDQLAPWWPPHRPSGWTLATTRLRDATLISSGRRQVDVDVYSPPESKAYLASRLTDSQAHLLDHTAADLDTALGHLPLALSRAAIYMINEDEPCSAYLGPLPQRRGTPGRPDARQRQP